MNTYIAYNCTAVSLKGFERKLKQLGCKDIQNLNDGDSFRFTCDKNTLEKVISLVKVMDAANKNIYILNTVGKTVVYDSTRDIKENRGFRMRNTRTKKRFIFENELSYTKEERKAFLESLKQFSVFKNEIYRSKRLKEISSQLGQMIESAEAFTLRETQDMFDNISVNRDLKSLKDDYKLFNKTCTELTQLQQRLEGLYENIGTKLGRYYDI